MVTDPVSKEPRKLFHEVSTTYSQVVAAGADEPGSWAKICMIRPNAQSK